VDCVDPQPACARPVRYFPPSGACNHDRRAELPECQGELAPNSCSGRRVAGIGIGEQVFSDVQTDILLRSGERSSVDLHLTSRCCSPGQQVIPAQSHQLAVATARAVALRGSPVRTAISRSVRPSQLADQVLAAILVLDVTRRRRDDDVQCVARLSAAKQDLSTHQFSHSSRVSTPARPGYTAGRLSRLRLCAGQRSPLSSSAEPPKAVVAASPPAPAS